MYYGQKSQKNRKDSKTILSIKSNIIYIMPNGDEL